MFVWTLTFSKISLLLCYTSEDYDLESLLCNFVAAIYDVLKSYCAGNFVLTDNESYAYNSSTQYFTFRHNLPRKPVDSSVQRILLITVSSVMTVMGLFFPGVQKPWTSMSMSGQSTCWILSYLLSSVRVI